MSSSAERRSVGFALVAAGAVVSFLAVSNEFAGALVVGVAGGVALAVGIVLVIKA